MASKEVGIHIPLNCANCRVIAAIRFFEPAVKPAKTVFMQIAYGWLLIAAALSIWAALASAAPRTL